MTKIKMRDTTAHAEHGHLLKGEVYDVPDEFADHLLNNTRLARKAPHDAETYPERVAREQGEQALAADDDDEDTTNPSIEAQVQHAGSRAGDQENASFPTREAINPPTRSRR